MEALPENSFLSILFSILEGQDAEFQKQFFTCPKEDLVSAYNQGVEAAKKKWPQSSNPYKQNTSVAYTQNLAWGEGWISVNTNLNNLLNL